MTEQEASEILCRKRSFVDEVRLFWYYISKVVAKQPAFWFGVLFFALAILTSFKS
jgi:hypothetical protein